MIEVAYLSCLNLSVIIIVIIITAIDATVRTVTETNTDTSVVMSCLVLQPAAPLLQVVITYALGTAAALAAFWACPNQPTAQWLAVATVGFFLYGPQMLIGLCGAEVVSPSAVGASQGFLGWISYLGLCSTCLPCLKQTL